MSRDERTNQGGERLLRAVALALASAGAEDTAAGDLIPQAVWDALYEERLIVLVRDVTGEGMTWTTEAGFEALREIVEEVSQTNQGGERPTLVDAQNEELRRALAEGDIETICRLNAERRRRKSERVILDLEAAAYERGWREAISEVAWVLRDRFDFERIADWIEREFGAAGSKRVPDTSKDLESGEAPTTGRER